MDKIKIIEQFLNDNIVSNISVGGGCIADSSLIKTQQGNRYFLKNQSGFENMFFKEAHSLTELAKPHCIRIPKVLLVDNTFLLLEYIETGIKGNQFFTQFGKQLAQVHKYTHTEYGFYEDNYIGASPQYNIAVGNEKTSWPEFYFQKRLLPQLHMAEKNGEVSSELRNGIRQLETKIQTILKDSDETPSLLHGDLWSGNFMVDNSGNAVLIDPAVYYGHRETDIAMTKMFGGFSTDFYTAYQQENPLASGWEYRQNIYLLYHYLNHLNLFGKSYYPSVMQLIKFYL